jgi:probable FeS assembly SUF system protein SufT
MNSRQPITLSRSCEATEIPSGIRATLPAGSPVTLMQSLGGSYTVTNDRGYMYRIDASDADAIGLTAALPEPPPSDLGNFNEQLVWEQLKTVFDPEIPVNIVDLGLIYSCEITPVDAGNKIDIKMSMTAPGCGMGNVLKADVEKKISGLPSVKEVQVEVVFDPPWNPTRMSDAAKLQLGFDLDYGT